jgi:hypothetical protein
VHTLAHTVPLVMVAIRLSVVCPNAILGRNGDTCFRVRSLGRISRPNSLRSLLGRRLHRRGLELITR